jgi:hypothetical protein
MVNRKIHDVKTDWLRIPLSQPIADSSHVLSFIDLILVEVRAGDDVGESYMLSLDYGPALLKGIVDQVLRRYMVGQSAEDIRSIYQRNLAATEYIGQEGLVMWGSCNILPKAGRPSGGLIGAPPYLLSLAQNIIYWAQHSAPGDKALGEK